MKKLLAISLAVIMMFALALPILAEETAAPYKVGETSYDTLPAAISAATAGSTVTLTKDHIETGVAGITINKNLTLDGGGFDLEIRTNKYGQGTNDNTFAFIINGGVTVNVTNFKEISSSGGGFNVNNGTLNISNVESAYTLGRVVVKTTAGAGNTSVANIENSTLKTVSETGSGETVLLVDGAGTNNFNLKNGANIIKNNKSNGNVNAAGAVIYVNGAGSTTINMESGSKLVSNCVAGNASGSIIGNNGSKTKFDVNIASGAYLVLDSANITNFSFVSNVSTKVLNLTAPDGAFLVKNGLTPTINPYQGGSNDNGRTYQFVALETSAVEGYTAYKMNATFNFEYDAADGSTQETGSLVYAITNVKDGGTIKLLKDLTISESGIAISKKVTLDLNNKTLAMTAGAYSFTPVTAAFTVKNGTLKMNGGIIVNGNGILTLDNLTGVQTMTGTWARPYIKLSGAGTTKLYMNNANITSLGANSGNEALILVEHSTDGFIYMTNNSWLKTNQASSNAAGQGAISVQTAAQTTDLELNVGAGCSIIDAHQTSTKDGAKVGPIVDLSVGNIVINLDEGAIVKFDYAPGTATPYFVNPQTTGGTVTVNDKGATWILSKEVAAKGLNLPAVANGDKAFLGYSDGTKMYTAASAITADTALTLKAVYMNDGDYDMIDGASLRTIYKENGLRFTTVITDELRAALGTSASYHTLIAAVAKLGENELTAALATGGDDAVAIDIVNTKVQDNFVNGETTYENAMHAAVLMNNAGVDAKTLYTTELAARGYIVITYANGGTATIYTDFDSTNNVRSMLDVAEALSGNDAYADNRVVNGIIAECNVEAK
ncbi:MAG: hypothetical protein IJV68_00310 [Clostridia bacterium]|nr:hypothetical protein [Clostridia bacterium]